MTESEKVTCGDFFAGGGGVTRALYNHPMAEVLWVLNHDKTAIETNIFHHSDVKHYWADIYEQDEHEMERADLVHASIECTQHSRAKGGKEKETGSYMMGWELYRYVKYMMPYVLTIENVPEFKKWGPVDENNHPIPERRGEHFEEWKQAFIDLGYSYKESIRNAADDGIPQQRTRYFAYFYLEGIDIDFPKPTHAKNGRDGKLPWVACRPFIETDKIGTSIFGRQFNKSLPRHLRKPLVPNTLKRIAGGIKKLYPEYHQFLCQYYGNFQVQDLESPINAVVCRDVHQLVTVEKVKFVMDYCRADIYQGLDDPLKPQLTRQTKQFVSFISHQNSSNGNPEANNHSLDDTMRAITTREKIQFICSYFNSGGNPGSQNQSLDEPINAILTSPTHKSLTTIVDDFDVFVRFLNKEELGLCSTFPRDYFSKPGLKLSGKKAIKLIGNSVPPDWARKILSPAIEAIHKYKHEKSKESAEV